MKALKLIFFSTIVLFGINAASAQCASEETNDKCSKKLIANFRYLKSYNVDGEDEYSYVFSRGNTYLIQTCNDSEVNGKMKITVLDRTKHKIAANYGKNGKITRPYLAYRCNSTSIYYVKFEVDEDEDEECGVATLGFK